MAHPPGHRGLDDRLQLLERRVDELTRRSSGHGVPIGSDTVQTARTSLDFADVPQYFHTLQLHVSANMTGTGTRMMLLRVNGMTRNYHSQGLRVAGTSTLASRLDDIGHIELGVLGPRNYDPSSLLTATIGGYATDTYTLVHSQCSYFVGPGDWRLWFGSGTYWGSMSPVTSVSLLAADGAQFGVGTTARLYGLR